MVEREQFVEGDLKYILSPEISSEAESRSRVIEDDFTHLREKSCKPHLTHFSLCPVNKLYIIEGIAMFGSLPSNSIHTVFAVVVDVMAATAHGRDPHSNELPRFWLLLLLLLPV